MQLPLDEGSPGGLCLKTGILAKPRLTPNWWDGFVVWALGATFTICVQNNRSSNPNHQSLPPLEGYLKRCSGKSEDSTCTRFRSWGPVGARFDERRLS